MNNTAPFVMDKQAAILPMITNGPAVTGKVANAATIQKFL